jgi:hypothetical protein
MTITMEKLYKDYDPENCKCFGKKYITIYNNCMGYDATAIETVQ